VSLPLAVQIVEQHTHVTPSDPLFWSRIGEITGFLSKILLGQTAVTATIEVVSVQDQSSGTPGGYVVRYDGKGNNVTQITDTQDIVFGLGFKDGKGFAVPETGETPSWVITTSTGAALATDGTQGTFVDNGNGSCAYNAGNPVTGLVLTCSNIVVTNPDGTKSTLPNVTTTVDVTPGNATTVNIVAGTPTEQTPPATPAA